MKLLKELYINDVPQSLASDSLLYGDNIWIVFQHKNATETEKQQLIDISSLHDWFVDNELSISFDQDTKSILFGIKYTLRNARGLKIKSVEYDGTVIN